MILEVAYAFLGALIFYMIQRVQCWWSDFRLKGRLQDMLGNELRVCLFGLPAASSEVGQPLDTTIWDTLRPDIYSAFSPNELQILHRAYSAIKSQRGPAGPRSAPDGELPALIRRAVQVVGSAE